MVWILMIYWELKWCLKEKWIKLFVKDLSYQCFSTCGSPGIQIGLPEMSSNWQNIIYTLTIIDLFKIKMPQIIFNNDMLSSHLLEYELNIKCSAKNIGVGCVWYNSIFIRHLNQLSLELSMWTFSSSTEMTTLLAPSPKLWPNTLTRKLNLPNQPETVPKHKPVKQEFNLINETREWQKCEARLKKTWKRSDHHTHVNTQSLWLNTERSFLRFLTDELDELTVWTVWQRPLSLLNSVCVCACLIL